VIALRKALQFSSVPLSVKLPPKRVREKFLIIYELEGCQKAVNYLTEYYGVRRIRIILDGRKVPKNCYGCYFQNKASFTRGGLKKRVVLHEFYHHLVDSTGLELPARAEERKANSYAR
jgi:hypothetical protein